LIAGKKSEKREAPKRRGKTSAFRHQGSPLRGRREIAANVAGGTVNRDGIPASFPGQNFLRKEVGKTGMLHRNRE